MKNLATEKIFSNAMLNSNPRVSLYYANPGKVFAKFCAPPVFVTV